VKVKRAWLSALSSEIWIPHYLNFKKVVRRVCDEERAVRFFQKQRDSNRNGMYQWA